MNILAGCPMGGRPFSFGLPSDWRVTPAVITEAVWAAKQFLEDIIDKYETFQELAAGQGRGLDQKVFGQSPMDRDYTKARNEGLGINLLQNFLGSKWTEMIRDALPALAEDAARAQAERLRKRQEREAAFFFGSPKRGNQNGMEYQNRPWPFR